MSTYPFEPELDQPAPRRARLRDGLKEGCALWFDRLFILPHTVIGIAMVPAAVWTVVLYLGVLLFGTDVDGRVVAKTQEQGKKRVRYSVAYAYTVDGREYRGRLSVDEAEYEATKEGDPFPLRVWRVVPGADFWWRRPGNWPILYPLGACGVALFWNWGLTVFLRRAYYRPRVHRHLVRRGRPAIGIVREVKAGEGEGWRDIRLTYEFAVPAGDRSAVGVFTGTMTAPGRGDTDPKVGEVVTVLYDPRRPKRNLVYRLAVYRAVGPAG